LKAKDKSPEAVTIGLRTLTAGIYQILNETNRIDVISGIGPGD
jgi:hypothetical protein